jgi:hypothetical protein
MDPEIIACAICVTHGFPVADEEDINPRDALSVLCGHKVCPDVLGAPAPRTLSERRPVAGHVPRMRGARTDDAVILPILPGPRAADCGEPDRVGLTAVCVRLCQLSQ